MPTTVDNGITFSLRTNLFLGTEDMGRRILKLLVEIGGPFVPEFFDSGSAGHGMTKFDPTNFSAPLITWTIGPYESGIIAERRRPIKVMFHVTTTDFTMFDFVGLTFCLDTKGQPNDTLVKWFVQNVGVERIVETAKKLYEIVSPNWGFIRNDFYERPIGQMLDGEGRLIGHEAPKGASRRALQGLFWANFFGPEYVQMFGRERLIAAPAYHVELLPDGGILLFLARSPFEASTEEYQSKKQELRSYLGGDAFNGNRLPVFRMGPGRKLRDARPLVETQGLREDIFWHSP